MKEWNKLFKQILMLSQLGLSLLTPLVMCVGICWWLQTSLGLGAWVYIPGFILGLGSSGMTFWKFVQVILNKEKKEKPEPRGLSFNRHE
ncbi:MAG: AtpZ/AtpI family protein [Lachnospiraceae bacterium]|nr:AtpZ/AtpI family protein [Lachnospiraceae bacterium]